MFFLRLTCPITDAEALSSDLWDEGTAGIQEIEHGGEVTLLAGFETNENRARLMHRFVLHSPEWEHDDATDWVAYTKESWPPRQVGEHLFLVPPWSDDVTPLGRHRIIHNPGLACGTGEHPCTQLALEALESVVLEGDAVTDIGTGSGLLSIAALRLGASRCLGVDIDTASLAAARENFELNGLAPFLVAGSADSLRSETYDVTVANINATVLLMLFCDLLRITRPTGTLILTGFTESEAPVFQRLLPGGEVSAINEWRCIIARRHSAIATL
jgi:ribosomal protein L11 methyltransferase